MKYEEQDPTTVKFRNRTKVKNNFNIREKFMNTRLIGRKSIPNDKKRLPILLTNYIPRRKRKPGRSQKTL